MSDARQAAAASRALLRSRSAGILSTHSVAAEGYPLGSLVPFVLTPEGRCVIYISRIAQHTKNFAANPRTSLTVVEADLTDASDDPQAASRVSVLGDAHVLAGADREAAKARYGTFFPESEGHAGVHDFDYWEIDPVRIRYIGGFGAIHWVERDFFCAPRAEFQDGEEGIVKHMNDDHRAQMALIWARALGDAPDASRQDAAAAADQEEETPFMLATDPEGFHMRWHGRIAYVPYAVRCETSTDVRKEMVRLTREARS